MDQANPNPDPIIKCTTHKMNYAGTKFLHSRLSSRIGNLGHNRSSFHLIHPISTIPMGRVLGKLIIDNHALDTIDFHSTSYIQIQQYPWVEYYEN